MTRQSTSRYQAVRAARTVRRRLLRTPRLVSQPVAVAPQRLDDRWRAGLVELAPQVADIDIDDVGLTVELPAPHALGDLGSAERLPGMAQQVFEYGELARRQHDLLRTARHSARTEIHRNVSRDEFVRRPQHGPPQERADAGEQFGERERLDQVVVGAGVEAGDAIIDGVPCREQQDRRRHAPLAQIAQQREAVELGQEDIEQDDVVGRRQRVVARFNAVAGQVDRVSGFAKALAKRARDAAFVLDDQQPHAITSRSGSAGPGLSSLGRKASFSSISHLALVAPSESAPTIRADIGRRICGDYLRSSSVQPSRRLRLAWPLRARRLSWYRSGIPRAPRPTDARPG